VSMAVSASRGWENMRGFREHRGWRSVGSVRLRPR